MSNDGMGFGTIVIHNGQSPALRTGASTQRRFQASVVDGKAPAREGLHALCDFLDDLRQTIDASR